MGDSARGDDAEHGAIRHDARTCTMYGPETRIPAPLSPTVGVIGRQYTAAAKICALSREALYSAM